MSVRDYWFLVDLENGCLERDHVALEQVRLTGGAASLEFAFGVDVGAIAFPEEMFLEGEGLGTLVDSF